VQSTMMKSSVQQDFRRNLVAMREIYGGFNLSSMVGERRPLCRFSAKWHPLVFRIFPRESATSYQNTSNIRVSSRDLDFLEFQTLCEFNAHNIVSYYKVLCCATLMYS